MEWRRKKLVESRLRVGMIFYGRRILETRTKEGGASVKDFAVPR
jgi:hypothetical protein